MSFPDRPLIFLAGIAGIVACLGDLLMPFILAPHVPGYSHLRHAESQLGMASSPVARWMNLWWIIFGVLMILTGVGIWRAFGDRGEAARALAAMVIVFGAGTGIGAGAFPMAEPGTFSNTMHNVTSGIGFVAILLAPAVSLWVFRRAAAPVTWWLCLATQIGGLVAAALVTASGSPSARGWLALGGLWQRVFLVNYYIYLCGVSVTLLRSATPQAA